LMAEEFARTARVYDEAQSRDGALHDLTQGALKRLLNSDPDFAKGLDALARRPDNDPDHSEIARHPTPGPQIGPGQRVMGGGASFAPTFVNLDPPYQYYWKDSTRVQANSDAQAYPQNGYLWTTGTIASVAPGDARSFRAAAAVGATFMRRVDGLPDGQGPEGFAWITPHVHDAVHLWTDRPSLATTSLGGGFGITVRSWDMNGHNQIDEFRTFKTHWSHQGFMFGESQNSDNFDPFYSGTLFGYESQAFRIRPGRLYMVWIDCQIWGNARNMWLRSALVETFCSGNVARITVHQT
jgi:hypothetical protein